MNFLTQQRDDGQAVGRGKGDTLSFAMPRDCHWHLYGSQSIGGEKQKERDCGWLVGRRPNHQSEVNYSSAAPSLLLPLSLTGKIEGGREEIEGVSDFYCSWIGIRDCE